jgi:hypothetical protein
MLRNNLATAKKDEATLCEAMKVAKIEDLTRGRLNDALAWIHQEAK